MGINNNYVKATVGLTLAVSSVPIFAPVYTQAATFSDVPDSAYYYDAVHVLAERGIINGHEDATFKPNVAATRGQTAKILAGILGLDTTNVVDPGFTDLSPDNPYYGAIAALVQAGIINGYEDRTFRMNEPLKRNHLAKMLVKSFNLQSPEGATMPLNDVHKAYKEYILALYTNGITTGKTDTEFDGESYVTRGQLAAFVVRAEEVVQAAKDQKQPSLDPTPPSESIPTPNPALTFTLSIEGMSELFSSNNEYELMTSAVIGKMYLEGDVVKITFVSEEAIPKESFKAKINNIEYEFNFSRHENKWIVTKFKETVLPVAEPTPAPYFPTTIPVTDIALNTTTATLNQGETTQLTPTILPTNAMNQNVTWTSSNPMVATVDTAGVVYSVGQGTAIITVTTVDGLKTAMATIDVVVPPTPTPVSVTGITLDRAHGIVYVGETTTLIQNVTPTNATNQNVTWSSSDQNVATVDTAGVVYAVSPGTATITATTVDGLKTATSIVEVVVPVTGITLNKTSENLNVGATTTLTATVEPTNATNQNVTWTSSNPTVATVDTAGVVYAVAPGTAMITATTTDGQHTATYVATVNPTVSIFGAIKIGNTLTADALTPTGATVTYQWQRSKPDGTYEDITGATNNTYTLVSGDENRFIRVVVTANDSSYSGTVTSDPITAIARMVQVQFEQAVGTPFNKNQTTPQDFILTVNILETVQISSMKMEFTNISFLSGNHFTHADSARTSFGNNLNVVTLYLPKLPTPNYVVYDFIPNSTLNGGTYTVPVLNGIEQTADSTSGTVKIWINGVLLETVEFDLH